MSEAAANYGQHHWWGSQHAPKGDVARLAECCLAFLSEERTLKKTSVKSGFVRLPKLEAQLADHEPVV